MLDAHGEPHQAILQAGGAPGLGRDRGVGHRGRRLHQGLHPPEGLGQGEHPRPHGERLAGGDAAGQLEAHHAAGRAHLAAAELVLGVARQARIVHPLDLGRGLQVSRDRGCIGAVPVHAHGQGLDAAQHEEAVHGPGRPAHGVLVERELLADRGVPRDQGTADHVGVTAQVLGQGVQDDVGPEGEGLLQVGRREGVVHHAERPGAVGELGRRADVRQAQQGVARGLEVHVARALGEGPLDLGQVGRVDEREADPVALEHAREEAPGPAVEVVARHHVVPRLEPVEERVAGCQARGEGQAAAALLERGEVGLQGRAGGVAGAAVLVVPDGLGRRTLGVGAGHVDRRHDGTGDGVGLLAGVDGEGLEAGVVGGAHGGLECLGEGDAARAGVWPARAARFAGLGCRGAESSVLARGPERPCGNLRP